MGDLTLIIPQDGLEFDLAMQDADLQTGDDLRTAVVISLFTWARAKSDDKLEEGESAQGWWGDNLSEDNYKIGSRLWLLMREKLTQETINRTEEYIKESLRWMLDDKVASKISVAVSRNGLDRIDADIQIYHAGGVTDLKFNDLWQQIINKYGI
jgi:phage gp46-like protein